MRLNDELTEQDKRIADDLRKMFTRILFEYEDPGMLIAHVTACLSSMVMVGTGDEKQMERAALEMTEVLHRHGRAAMGLDN